MPEQNLRGYGTSKTVGRQHTECLKIIGIKRPARGLGGCVHTFKGLSDCHAYLRLADRMGVLKTRAERLSERLISSFMAVVSISKYLDMTSTISRWRSLKRSSDISSLSYTKATLSLFLAVSLLFPDLPKKFPIKSLNMASPQFLRRSLRPRERQKPLALLGFTMGRLGWPLSLWAMR